VVMQLCGRMANIFLAQPSRKIAWGLGLDKDKVIFFRQKKGDGKGDEYHVTAVLDLWGEGGNFQKVWNFLCAPMDWRGYVAVDLPVMWGAKVQCMISNPRPVVVFALSDVAVGKAGHKESKSLLQNEVSVMQTIWKKASECCLCPKLLSGCEDTGNDVWRWGFKMGRYEPVSLLAEESLVKLLGDVFWGLAVVHRCGYVHNDVKPGNMLVDGDGRYLLCDFGSAERWQPGEPMCEFLGATESYKAIPKMFRESEASMRACDAEGLYWSVLALWVQLQEQSEHLRRLHVDERCNKCSSLREMGGYCLRTGEVKKPQHPVLAAYLTRRELLVPLTLFAEYAELCKKKAKKDWVTAIRAREEREHLPPCPPEVLAWLIKEHGK